MARLRYNGLRSTLGSSLSNSDTSITFAATLTHAGGTNVPTLSGSDHIMLTILDAQGRLAEIVKLTAYTAGGTTGTIARAQESTTAISHSSGATVTNALTVGDYNLGANPEGFPDTPPLSPSAYDDEFDAPLSGWTTMGSPTTLNADTDIVGHLRIVPVIATGDNAQGIYKTPPSIPFTVTAKLADASLNANFNRAGLFIGEATPGKVHSVVHGYNSAAVVFAQGEALTPTGTLTLAGTVTMNATPVVPAYLRIIVNSTTSVTYQYSLGGKVWRTLVSADNPGFTIGAVGLWSQAHNATTGGETAWEWIRFS